LTTEPRVELRRDPSLISRDRGTAAHRVLVDGVTVGFVADYRPFTGARYAGRRWHATHNPTCEPWQALWHGEGYRSRKAAVAALVERAS
jgi:hypothetical protein